jgi:PAS domain S-box-containing protein
MPGAAKESGTPLRLMASVLNGLRDAVYLVDEGARLVYVNDEACRALGYDRTELLRMSVGDIDRAFLPSQWESFWVDHEFQAAVLLETRHRAKDGRVFPVEVHASPFHSDGRSLALGVVRDISEREIARRERRDQAHFFESMDRVNVAIQGTNDLERMMHDVLHVVQELLDCDRTYLIHPCDPDAATWSMPMGTGPVSEKSPRLGELQPMDVEVASGMRLALSAEGPVRLDPGAAHQVQPGIVEKYGVLSALMMAIYPRTGQPWLFGIHQRRSARKWTEQEVRLFEAIGRRLADALTSLVTYRHLKESEERFRQAFEMAGVGMAMLDLEGNILRGNRRLLEIFAFSEEEMRRLSEHDGELVPAGLTVNIRELALPEDYPADMAELQAIASGAESYAQRELRARRRDGEIIWIGRTAAVLRDAAGRPVNFIAQVEDVTERRNYEAELHAARDKALTASRMKSEFLANMSHEIRTPLNGIIGMATLLAGMRLDAEQAGMNRVVVQSAETLLTIISDILDFSKIEAGKFGIRPAPMSLRKTIEDTLALLAPLAASKRLELRREIDPELDDPVMGDEIRIRQVLVNLVGNAVKFTNRGEVRVIARGGRSEDGTMKVSLEVRDTGPGITAAAQPHIFEAFTQAETGTMRHFGGTGLGLAITRQLIDLMGGRISFTSQEGVGTTFRCELRPALAPRDALPEAPPAAPAVPAAVRKLSLLVAEDNRTNQLVIRKILQRMGHRADLAENGLCALEQLASSHYDAVLMDCEMPECDGYTATHRIRSGEVPGQARIPIIALTAHALPEVRTQCLLVGMNEYVTKPVRIDDLQRAFTACGLD